MDFVYKVTFSVVTYAGKHKVVLCKTISVLLHKGCQQLRVGPSFPIEMGTLELKKNEQTLHLKTQAENSNNSDHFSGKNKVFLIICLRKA